ncbi:32063_t:CDS:10 [Racocetra persica]|uniref:32063_t:CDS:1 n=1 Tax=Racocetra persica TaxID=160502 RepID=A0ACA9LLD5_9GLOM|nr:32063_t:CDS:10 [Racocetra persica]
MSDYSPYYNNQVFHKPWENQNMPPAQDLGSYDSAASTSVTNPRVNNWVNVNGSGNYPQGYLNGGSTGYGGSLSEQPSTNHVSAQRGAPNGISVNTSNLMLRSNSSIIETDAGNISQLNKLAEETGAMAIIHSENSSLERISDRTLRHLVQYSTIIPQDLRSKLLHPSTSLQELRNTIQHSEHPLLSEFPLFREGVNRLSVPVYTVWGACEDVAVLEKFREKIYKVHNLHILDEANSHLIEVGGVSLRLFGLGGAVVQHKLFDNGQGSATIAGGHGTMWTTILQIGELVETAQKVFDQSETRVLVTHASPGREGLLTQLSVVLRADFTISAGLHFRYGISYNEFSVQRDAEAFRIKLETSRRSFYEMWESVKNQVESYIDDQQKVLLQNAFSVVDRVPAQGKEEPVFRNMWNFNLPDAAYGWVLLDIKDGRISAETKAQALGGSQTSEIGAPTSPCSMDRNRRQQSNWQPSPALPPQPSNGGGSMPSPILTPQRSTSPETTPNLSSDWKKPLPDSATANEWSSSSKGAVSLSQDHMERPSNILGSDTSSNDDNDIINSTNSGHINGNSWADRAQNETPNWENKPEFYTNLAVFNRSQKNPFKIYVGNLNPPVSDEDLQNYFESFECQVERVQLNFDNNKNQLNHAYVVFQDESSMEKAVALNGKPFGGENGGYRGGHGNNSQNNTQNGNGNQ